MGFLHKIWDDTLAGPAPDSGLGKLRKYNSFSARSAAAPPVSEAPPHDNGGLIPISRSITVVRSNGHGNDLTVSVDSPSSPSTPDGSTTPRSPFSPSMPGGNVKKFNRRKPKGPTGYDWIVLSALDR